MAGIKDIASAAGVSPSTVSNVLNGKENVGEETRRKVLSLCDEMNYSPNLAGRNLKAKDSNTILFNFSDFDRTFYLKIINGIHDYANDNKYDLIICTNKSCEKYMRNHTTSGAIILDERMKSENLKRLAGEHYPVVVLDRHVEHPHISSIVVNNEDAMSQLVQGLVDRGYTRFGFVGGLEHTADNKERYRAFLETLEQNQLSFQSQFYYSGDYREKSGYRAAKILMLNERMPQVLVCANDNMAIGAMKAFREDGLRVPDDIAVTGFDDCDLAGVMGVTTVAIPNYERGYLAAQYLIERIRSGEQRFAPPFKITAKVKWRKTVGGRK